MSTDAATEVNPEFNVCVAITCLFEDGCYRMVSIFAAGRLLGQIGIDGELVNRLDKGVYELPNKKILKTIDPDAF